MLVGILIFLISSIALSEPPGRPLKNFESTKRVARDVIYTGHNTDFYCGCGYTSRRTGASVTIEASECGYTPGKNKARGKKLEWEHVVFAYYFDSKRTCWKKGNAKCIKADGTHFKGRACCSKVDKTFKKIEADLHNLTPAVGELNGDRSNLPYGIVRGEPREYGQCDSEIGCTPRVTEPRINVRGDAARIWRYMADIYRISLTNSQRQMFEAWSKDDPVDRRERLRNLRIEAVQGNRNEHEE